MGPGDLDQALCGMEIPFDPAVLVGLGPGDDAGVYRISEEVALVQTVDFFTPIVDDPRTFGQVAAANSLSDIYAMGGRPITAMNVVCFPGKKLGVEPLRQILMGSLDTLKEAGVALLGGHTVEDAEPKFGLSVTGLIHPMRILTKDRLKVGDRIILTKPLGTGVISTALKARMVSPSAYEAMVRSMRSLNRAASEAALEAGAVACTDVTGFGLLGHMMEMARASGMKVRLDTTGIPLLEGAWDCAAMGLVPGGARANRSFFSPRVEGEDRIDPVMLDLLYDPQTSGGLLIAVPQERVKALEDGLRSRGVATGANIALVECPYPGGKIVLSA
jgi:selenide,water dikinase